MLEDAVKTIQHEWSTLTAAPWAFLILVAAAFALAYAAANWRYFGVVEQLRARLETLKERLEAKDGQLDEYRERLHLMPAAGSQFSRLTQAELKDKALTFVRDLRRWLAKYRQEDDQHHNQEWAAMTQANGEEERQRLWHQSTASSSQRSLKCDSDYDEKFKVDSILLRDELLARLGEGSKQEPPFSMYEHPTNPIGMGMVTDDVERMAKLLC